MSLNMNALTLGDLGFPRPRGDEPRVFTNAGARAMFSPPARG